MTAKMTPVVALPPSLDDELRELTARVMLREAVPDELVRLACDLIVAGVDIPSVTELAGMPSTVEMRDAQRLFLQMVEDLGRPPVATEEAAWVVARKVAQQLWSATIPPARAAGILWGLWWDCGNPKEIAAFVQLLDAWEERLPGERVDLEDQMRQLAPAVIQAADRALPAHE